MSSVHWNWKLSYTTVDSLNVVKPVISSNNSANKIYCVLITFYK